MTFVMQRLDQVLLGVHSDATPSDEEWECWRALLCQRAADERLRVLVEAHEHSGPDARQRKLLRHTTAAHRDYKTAVLTESMLTRGIITAVAWLGIPTRGYSFREYSAAFTFLDLSQREMKWALGALDDLRVEAGVDLEMYVAMRPRVSRLSLFRRSQPRRDRGT